MTKAAFERKNLVGAYNFRGWVPDHHGREYGSRQSGMVLPGVVVDSLSKSTRQRERFVGGRAHT